MSDADLLLSPEGAALLEALRDDADPADPLATTTRLRKAGHPPLLIAAVLTQLRLRTKARAKFGDFAEGMLFTQAGLEQATRLPVAALHAGRFRAAGIRSVADLGCGIGGDALAFAASGLSVVAVERDPVAAAFARANLAPFPEAEVIEADAVSVDLDAVDAVWLDPARREGAKRLVDPADYSPPLDWALAVGMRMPAGIKLAPGMDRELLPAESEAQWVSDSGDVVELVLWSGSLARDGIRRAALVIAPDGAAHEVVAPADAPDVEVRPLGDYVYEPDGAVIRARLIGTVAAAAGLGMLADQIAYVTGDAHVTSPFLAGFRVREVLPMQEAKLRAALKERDIGVLEIKKRGVDLDPAGLRARLRLKGSGSATLIATRLGDKRVAILADRV